MAQGFYGSFCLDDLFGQAVITAQDGKKYVCIDTLQGAHINRANNGKTYVNIGVWLNDQADSYGNVAGITLQQSREASAAKEKRTYIGNLKMSGGGAPQAAPAPQYAQPAATPFAAPVQAQQPVQQQYQQQQPAQQGWQQPAPGNLDGLPF